MKNKILLSLLFLIAFILLFSVSDKVNALTVTCQDREVCFDGYILFKYNFVSFNKYNGELRLYSTDTPFTDTQIGDNYVTVQFNGRATNVSYWYNKNEFVVNYEDDQNFSVGGGFAFESILYCDYDICDADGNVVFASTVEVVDLNLTVMPDYDTKNVPIKISTDFYSLKVFEDILVQYSTNQEDWETCKWGRITDVNSSNNGKYNFYLDVYRNGTYYFRLWNAADNIYIYKTVVISNIVYSPDDVNNYVNGVFDPTPFLTYEYINDNKINIITQKFFIDQIIDLQCFYAKDISKEDYNNKEKWTKVEARTMIDQLSQRDVYQFCFEVDNNSFNADGTYTVCFYNVFLDKYTYSEIVINFDEILKVDGSMIWRYVHFFKERFGFLIYPFDLTINTLKRIVSIDYGEPKFNIPDIYEPTTNKKLISAVTFNFNDYLENNTFKTVHNIYLIIVDAAIIFGLLNLAWKKISGVFK